MAFSIKKSRGFDRSFTSVINTNNVNLINKRAKHAGERANLTTPYDEGKLRNSLSFTPATKRNLVAINRWSAMNKQGNFDYSAFRYNYNNKNPQTTRWAEKDYKKYGTRDAKGIGVLSHGRNL